MIVEANQLGVNSICALLGISKDSYYNSKNPQSSLTIKYQHLKPKITKIIEDNPAYGYPRIKTALARKYGEIVNHKLLLKLLKLWGLSLRRKIRKKKKTWIVKVLDFLQIRANLLRRLIIKKVINHCFQVIVSDITEIPFKGGKAYLAVHLDYFGKLVLGWKLSLSPDRMLVIASFKMAIKTIRSFVRLGLKLKDLKKIIFHQDRGSQYTSADYITSVFKVRLFKTLLSFSRKGEPGDNAVNEAFFSRLKDDWRDIFFEAETFEKLEKLVKEAIVYYNTKRYHTSIDNQTPLEFTKKQLKNFSR